MASAAVIMHLCWLTNCCKAQIPDEQSRTYVITGDPIYKRYFTEIYDIRRGATAAAVELYTCLLASGCSGESTGLCPR